MTKPNTKPNAIHYSTYADILANALVSDRPEIMQIEQLSPAVRAQIASGQQQGLHLVSVRWLSGQFALMFCEPGCNMPSSEKVIAAYSQCRWATNTPLKGGTK
ncbi:hypothetical protein [Rhodoferax sp. PAMC 29310]|uniref:hypothetical protein n=1 Tax=Rhodoferax sp. PAMC 29310 TaxID=2822760 RepID=UPI001B31F48A|nr:hypothetical protein [Rhodoferax sp. PAMC 29310]